MAYKPEERQYRLFSVPLQVRAADEDEDDKDKVDDTDETTEEEPTEDEPTEDEDEKEEEKTYIVEGYATTFNDPYRMFSYDGVDYFEQIDRDALTAADMSDVLFLYNHEGMVYARISNGTLTVSPNERGLYVRADLGKTEAARQMYEAIKEGMVTQMSWAFTIGDDGDSYDEDSHTRTISRVAKVFDVSAVSMPANPATDISARSYYDGVIEREAKRRSDLKRAEEIRAAIRAKIGGTHEN